MKDSNPLEYARMLEIPVSTCQVTVKKSRKRKKKMLDADELKQQVMDRVNARLAAAPTSVAEELAEEEPVQIAEVQAEEGEQLTFDALPAPEDGEEQVTMELGEEPDFVNDFSTVTVTEKRKKGLFGFFHRKKKRVEKSNAVMGLVFASMALVAVIFLTNVFMPSSAINRLIRTVFAPSSVETADVREYAEFTAASPYRAGDVVLENGVMTFEGTGTLYAPCDGVVTRIVEEAGKFAMEIEHSKKFRTVLTGIDFAYCDVGDSVYGALPVGYVEGGTVFVSMYNDGVLLQNYVIDGGAVVWQS